MMWAPVLDALHQRQVFAGEQHAPIFAVFRNGRRNAVAGPADVDAVFFDLAGALEEIGDVFGAMPA